MSGGGGGGNKVPLFFVASESAGPSVRPSVLESSERGCCCEGGREEDNGELSCRINFVGL